MCDTLIHEDSTVRLFAKNSDRSPNEPNLYLYVPGSTTPNDSIRCTYRQIADSETKNAVFLVKPSWMFGAEMGINEHGVAIGNEAVFSRAKKTKGPALLGMDLLRLALERASSAKDAVQVIVDLLSHYGQGGNGGFDRHLEYDNSFLIQDDRQSFVLEILGKDWAVKEVMGKANISNKMALDSSADAGSLSSVHFPKRWSDPLFTFFSKSKDRHCAISEALSLVDVPSVPSTIQLMSSHRDSDVGRLYQKGSGGSVCMHKSLLGDHTTASMIVFRKDHMSTIWLSNGSTPCLSLYLPTYFGHAQSPVFLKEEDALAFWLTREYLRRAIYAGWVDQTVYLKERDRLQAAFLKGDEDLRAKRASMEEYMAFQEACAKAEAAWMETHVEAIRRVVREFRKLPAPWDKLTARLGKHVFARTLTERKQP